MSAEMPECPSCGQCPAELLGPIPDTSMFGGALIDRLLPGGSLWECPKCKLLFKYPHLSKASLDDLYRRIGDEAWRTDAAERRDWQLAYAELATRCPTEILDVGCFDGRFLQGLGKSWRKFGLEINGEQGARASAMGIEIVGQDFYDLACQPNRFGVITAFDVIEHVFDPEVFLRDCRAALQPLGILIVATGNAKSWPRRLHGPQSRYCICAEHISFLTPDWLRANARTCGWQIERIDPYRRSIGGPVRLLRDLAANLAFAAAPALIKGLRAAGVGTASDIRSRNHPPMWPTARDHMLAILRKPTA